MRTFGFEVNFHHPNLPANYDELLYAGGCNDGLAAHGPGGCVIDFDREANDFPAAIHSALRDILKALPEAVILQVRIRS